jgi:spore coat polysaccharide biosynthesis protein SpsF
MYKTDQEKFWANEFGTEYIERNQGEQLLASNLNFFSKALQQAGRIESCIEFGANICMNLKALQLLYPSIKLNAIEINENAANILGNFIGRDNVYNGSIFEHTEESKVQLSLIKGVLIHINPNMLQKVYEQLYNCSEKFILIAEYYNPTPVALNYSTITTAGIGTSVTANLSKNYGYTNLPYLFPGNRPCDGPWPLPM